MNSNFKAIQTCIALFFVAVAVASSVQLVRFNSYMDSTVHRDEQQEHCIAQTLQALKDWVEYRRSTNPVEAQQVNEYFNQHPLPNCSFTGQQGGSTN